MNTLINITLNNETKNGFQNVHINEIHNIPDYSVDILTFSEIKAVNYNSCEQIISILFSKIRPQTGICILEIMDMHSICELYINKMIDSSTMSNIVAGIQNVFSTTEIKTFIEKSNNIFSILKIENNTDQNKILITIKRNTV